MDQTPKGIEHPAAQSGIFKIGGDTPAHRLGFGAMRLTGNGLWGELENPAECIAVLRRAVDLGINFIDTADARLAASIKSSVVFERNFLQ